MTPAPFAVAGLGGSATRVPGESRVNASTRHALGAGECCARFAGASGCQHLAVAGHATSADIVIISASICSSPRPGARPARTHRGRPESLISGSAGRRAFPDGYFGDSHAHGAGALTCALIR